MVSIRHHDGPATLTPQPRPGEEPPPAVDAVVDLQQTDELRPDRRQRTKEWHARVSTRDERVRLLMGYRVEVRIGDHSGVGVLFTDGRIQGIDGSPLGPADPPPRLPGR